MPYLAQTEVRNTLDDIQAAMFQKAKGELDESMARVTTEKSVEEGWNNFMGELGKGNLIQAPYCDIPECEDKIKELSAQGLDTEAGAPSMGAKALCIPFKPIEPFCPGTAFRSSHVKSEKCFSGRILRKLSIMVLAT